MCKPYSVKFAQLVLASFLVFCVSVTRFADGQDNPGPEITHGGIDSVDGEEWAHKDDSQNESCDLVLVDPVDYDLVGGALIFEDPNGNDFYVTAEWDGGTKGHCSPQWDATNTSWLADGTGSSVVTAELHDQDYGVYDDYNPTANLLQGVEVNGFTVYAELTVDGDISGGPVTVHEGAAQQTISAGPISYSGWATANGSGAASVSQYVHQQVDFKTVPSNAEPRRNISASLEYKPSADWYYNLDDNDYWEAEGDSVGLTFGWSEIVAATVTYNWVNEDDYEGFASGVWTYDTNASGVGSDRGPSSPDLFIESGDDPTVPSTYSVNQTAMTKSGLISRQKGQTSHSAYTISGGAKAIGGTGNWAQVKVRFNNYSFKLSDVTY